MSTLIKQLWLGLYFTFSFWGCSIHYAHITLSSKGELSVPSDVDVEHKIVDLSQALCALSTDVDSDEAHRFARTAILYTLYLQEKYAITTPSSFNNLLINLGIKERGLCYHWAGDLRNFLQSQQFKSFDIHWAVHAQRSIFEHNALVVTSAGSSFYEGLILDPWRDAPALFHMPVSLDESYHWEESRIYPPIRGNSTLSKLNAETLIR